MQYSMYARTLPQSYLLWPEQVPPPLDMGILVNVPAAVLTPSQLLNSMHGLGKFVDSRPGL